MGDIERQYLDILKKSCEKVVLEYFPQMEAGDLIYREIKLADIYVPLPLWAGDFDCANYRNENIIKEEISGEDLRRLLKEPLPDVEDFDLESTWEWEEIDQILNGEDFRESIQENPPASENIAEDICKNNDSNSSGMRALLVASAGGGKTFFCKRLILAYLKNEAPFFEQYNLSVREGVRGERGELRWEQNTFPLLLNCKYLKEMPKENLENILFPELAYRLCCMEFGEEFQRIGYESFCTLLEAKVSGECCFILDGWNEILDTRKEDTVWQIVKKYLQSYPMIDLIIAVRKEYASLHEWSRFSHFFEIERLRNEEIAAFCEKWYKVIFNDDQVNQKKYVELTEQILQSSSEQIRTMAERPLTLSLMLAISRYDAKLSKNKAVLLKQLCDLYIFWNTKKSGKRISREVVTLYLAYIAVCFTKREIDICSYSELAEMIRQCNIDLRNSLPAEADDYEISEVIEQLVDTEIFRISWLGGYAFTMFGQMREYLTAYAILTQSADREYNSMEPEEILKDKYTVVTKKTDVKGTVYRPEDKYTISKWKDVIVFAALMDTGKLRYTIIVKLLKKAKKTKAAYMSYYATFEDVPEEIELGMMFFSKYSDMLKEIAESVTDISPDYRQKMDEILRTF